MKKFLIFLVALIVGLKYGSDYLTSPDFQAYGDRTKAPWTCQVNNLMGHFLMFMGQYRSAIPYFQKTVDRCPETSMSEIGEFEVAECLSKTNRYPEAIEVYRAFSEHYPTSERAPIAKRAVQLLQQ